MTIEKQDNGKYHIFGIEGIETPYINLNGEEYKIIRGHETEDYMVAVIVPTR